MNKIAEHPVKYIAAQLALIFFATVACGDVYVVSSSIVLALLPLTLFFFKEQKDKWTLHVFLFFFGLFAGFSNYMRTHSGTLVLLFVVILIVRYWPGRWGRKLFFMLLIAGGAAVPAAHFYPILKERNAFLQGYSPEGSKLSIGSHVLWFNVYIGLGFLDNPHGVTYRDSVATEKYQSLLPGTYGSNQETERVLKKAVFDFIRAHPIFFLKTMLVKLAYVLGYLLVYANVGLWFRLKRKTPLYGEWAFLGALGFGSLNGFVTIPHPGYLLGFGAVAVLYGIWNVLESEPL